MRSFLTAAILIIASPAAFAATNTPVTEGSVGNTTISITLQRPPGGNSDISGNYQTVDGTATTADNDYIGAAGKFTIPAGQISSAPILITIIGDLKVEADETFSLEVSNVQGGALLDSGPFVFTVVNDDFPVFTVSDARVVEGNSGTTTMTFTVGLTAPAGVAVQAPYRTADITATAGQDYQAAEGTVTFAPGEVQKPVAVTVNGDTTVEPDETLSLTVTAPVGGGLAVGIGTIVNDDVPGPATLIIVSGNGQSGRLGSTLAQPLVVRILDSTGAPSVGATVQWRVLKGAAALNPATSTTNAQGLASTSVTVNSVGAIDIQASAGSLTPVTFTVSSQTSFEARAKGPVAIPVAHALDQVCAKNATVFAEVCRTLSQLTDDALTPALERIAPQTSGAESKVTSAMIEEVTSGIRSRLAGLRRGERLSVQHLSLNVNGRALPVSALANALMSGMQSGAEESEYNGWSGFLSGNLGTGERIGRFGTLGFDLRSHGVMLGVDRQFGDNVVGVSVNVMRYKSTLNDSAGSLDTDGYALSLYGSRGGLLAGSAAPSAGTGTHYDGVHLEGSLTLGRNRYDAEHVVDVPGNPPAHSRNNANVFAIAGGTGIDAHRGRTEFDASLSGTWSRAKIDDLTEDGSGPLILFVDGHDIESATATAGFSIRSAWPVSFGTVLPSFRAELNHEFKSGARLVTAHFLHDLDSSFTVPIDRPDANYAKLAAGLQAVFARGYSAYVEVTQDVLRSDLHFRTIQVNVSKSF